MRFSTSWAALALSAGAFAQLQVTDSIGASILAVLATAIPPESISKATADPAAFSSELDSSLSAGNTPAWYQALPSDVKSALPLLYPADAPAMTTSAPASSATGASSSDSSEAVEQSTPAPSVSASPTGGAYGNGTATISSATLASTGGANSETGGPAQHTGAAAANSAFVSAGLFGVVAMLFL